MKAFGFFLLSFLALLLGLAAALVATIGSGFVMAHLPYFREMDSGYFRFPRHVWAWLTALAPILLAGCWYALVLAAWAPLRKRRIWEEHRARAKAWAWVVIVPPVMVYAGALVASERWDLNWMANYVLPWLPLVSALTWCIHWSRKAAKMASP